MRDSVDLDLIRYENDCERIDDTNALANKADSANDDLPTDAEQDRMIAAYNARMLSEAAAWLARPIKARGKA